VRAPLVLASLVAAAMSVAACGQPGDGPALSEDEYLGRARLICAELDRQAQLADDGLLATIEARGRAGLSDARRVVANFAPVVADARAALAELRPPESRRPAAEAYLAALERAQARLVSAGASERATQRFLAGGDGVLPGLDADEAALGLDACVGKSSREAAGPTEDAAAQAALRTALVTEQLLLAGDDVFSESPEDFRLLQPDGRYEVGLTPSARPGTVTVEVVDDGTGVYLSTRSRSGRCFYVAARSDGQVGYAADPECGPADAQGYAEEW